MSELWRLSETEISELVRTKQVSAVEVTHSVLGRLEQANPPINALVAEMPEEATSKSQQAAIDSAYSFVSS